MHVGRVDVLYDAYLPAFAPVAAGAGDGAAVTGDGSAEKAAVTKMIARILRLEQLPRPADAADALAIAVCHGWRSGVGAGLDAQAATTTTHQGARTGMQRAAQERGTVLTPAQRAWQAAEQKARRGR